MSISSFEIGLIALFIFTFSAVSTAGLERNKWVERGLAAAVGVWVLTWWFGGKGVEVMSNATELVALIVSVLVSYLASLWLAAKAKPHYEHFFQDEQDGQDEQNRKYLGLIEKAVKLSVFFIPFLFLTNLIMQVVLPIFKTGEKAPNSVIEHLGTFGDFFGGTLNPVLTFATFIALIATILIQLKELRLTREELKNSNKMLEMSQQEQAKTAKALQDQEKTQRLQQFENTFFSLLDRVSTAQDNLSDTTESKITAFLKDNNKKEVRYFCYALIRTDAKAISFFILLYQLLKMIDSYRFINLTFLQREAVAKGDIFPEHEDIIVSEFEIKKKYMNMVRACISNNVLFVMFFHCSGINKEFGLSSGFESYRNYVEKYSFFEHLDFTDFMKPYSSADKFNEFNDVSNNEQRAAKFYIAMSKDNSIEVYKKVYQTYDRNAFGDSVYIDFLDK